MDPNNLIVKLCAQGMGEEARGNLDAAAKLFKEAWEQSTDDFERCIAAHYVARHQPGADLALYWNQKAMDCALRIIDGSGAEFFPSLYLNLGKSHEDLGNPQRAWELYQCAAGRLGYLPAGAYREIVEDGVRRGLQRVAASATSV
jgi:tetratricopeptide (TPR) repeat protein